MENIKPRVSAFVVLLGIWILATVPFSPTEFIFGAGVSLFLVLIPLPGLGIYGEVSFLPRKVFYSLLFLVVFLKELVRANLDVAFRVLKPRLPINPGIVKVKTRLRSRLGRLFLANSITLTPGTITVEADGGTFYVHWIDISADDPEGATGKIVAHFEKYLEVIFG